MTTLTVHRVAHAGLALQWQGSSCLIDPLLTNSFESGFLALEPPIKFLKSAFRKTKWDAVILSHSHSDHFSLESLALLDRKTPIFMPAGDTLMPDCLQRLGFSRLREINPREMFTVGGIRFIATPSAVAFPEMGILFQCGGLSCWNMVDSVVSRETCELVRSLAPRLDVLFCKYQPMMERELTEDTLGGGFPLDRYRKHLEDALGVHPHAVVPTSCGIVTRFPWVNDRLFPVTEAQFLADLREMEPGIRDFSLNPGDALQISSNGARVRRQTCSFVKTGPRGTTYDWNPSRGIPALADFALTEGEGRDTKKELRSFLDGSFIEKLRHPRMSRLRETLRKYRVLWELEIVYPGSASEKRAIDFGARKIRWKRLDPGDFPKIRTTASSSVILALRTGSLSSCAADHSGLIRSSSRPYAIRGRKILKLRNSRSLDPLKNVLYELSAEKNALWRVRGLVQP